VLVAASFAAMRSSVGARARRSCEHVAAARVAVLLSPGEAQPSFARHCHNFSPDLAD